MVIYSDGVVRWCIMVVLCGAVVVGWCEGSGQVVVLERCIMVELCGGDCGVL